MKHDDKQHTTAWIGDVLDREADALDATTRARLARMRQEALDGPRPVVRFAWVTAGAFAAAGLLAISLVFFHQPGAIGGDQPTSGVRAGVGVGDHAVGVLCDAGDGHAEAEVDARVDGGARHDRRRPGLETDSGYL